MLGFFQWCDASPLAQFIRSSRVLFPIIETIHILALAVLLGSVFIRGLRILGVRALAPLCNGSLAVMLSSGFLLFISEAMKCYDSPPFRLKMITLAIAIVFEYAIMRSGKNIPSKIAGALSVFLWFGVATAGRAIGFY